MLPNSNSVVATETITTPSTDTKTQDDLAVPWQVIIYNDPVNLMTHVTRVIQRVFGYPRQKAERMMMEVHTQGRSIVWTGERERAELYVHQLQSFQLLAAMEKAID